MQTTTATAPASRPDPAPWTREPDYWSAFDEPFHLLAIRQESGVWNGYIGVPAVDYVGDYDLDKIKVHGGITGELRGIHATAAGGLPNYRYPGFDCDHVGDLRPRRRAAVPRAEVYRTLEFVIAELRSGAEQLVKQRSWWWRARRRLRRLLTYRPRPAGLPPAS